MPLQTRTLSDDEQEHLDDHNNIIKPVIDAYEGTTPASFRAAGSFQTATQTPFSATGTISSTNTQGAVAEVASEAATNLSSHAALATGVHGITSGNIESTTGSQAKVNTHAGAAGAHTAANISFAADTTQALSSTTVQNAIVEVAAERVKTAILAQPGGVATLDGSGILDATQRPPAGTSATFTSIAQYPVSTNSIPLGTNDARAALNTLATTVGNAGGGVIVIDRLVSMNMAMSGSNCFGLRLPNNVWLQITPNGRLELLPSQPFGAPAGGAVYAFIMNNDLSTGKNVRIFGGGTINCRAAQQVTAFVHQGIRFQGSDGCGVEDITIKNVHGTASGPPGETFHIQHYRSSNGYVRGCTVLCDDAGQTATGVSADDAFNISVENTLVEGMTVGHGFTNSRSRDIYYDGCSAFLNFANGFNNEHPCGPIEHRNGRCGSFVGTPSNGGTMGRYSLNQDIGNGSASYHGFVLYAQEEDNGRASFLLDGVKSMNNKQGLTFSIAAAHAVPTRIVNSVFRFNDGFGVSHTGMSAGDLTAQQAVTRIERSSLVQDNVGGQFGSGWAFAT